MEDSSAGTPLAGRLTRILLEGAVVVGSILLAFSLDAWWDERQLGSEVRQDLESVRQECEENQRRVVRERERLVQVVAANVSLLGILDAAPASSAVPVPDTLAWLATSWAPTLDLSLGAVDALTSSGRLAAVDNLDLRNGLAGLKGKIGDVLEEEVFARQLLASLYLPAVANSLDFSPLSRVDDAVAASWKSGQKFPSFGLVSFPNRLDGKNAIRARLVWYAAAINEMHTLEGELGRLVTLISIETSP